MGKIMKSSDMPEYTSLRFAKTWRTGLYRGCWVPTKDRAATPWFLTRISHFEWLRRAPNLGLREPLQREITGHLLVFNLCLQWVHIYRNICLSIWQVPGERRHFTAHQLSFCMLPTPSPSRHLPNLTTLETTLHSTPQSRVRWGGRSKQEGWINTAHTYIQTPSHSSFLHTRAHPTEKRK